MAPLLSLTATLTQFFAQALRHRISGRRSMMEVKLKSALSLETVQSEGPPNHFEYNKYPEDLPLLP